MKNKLLLILLTILSASVFAQDPIGITFEITNKSDFQIDGETELTFKPGDVITANISYELGTTGGIANTFNFLLFRIEDAVSAPLNKGAGADPGAAASYLSAGTESGGVWTTSIAYTIQGDGGSTLPLTSAAPAVGYRINTYLAYNKGDGSGVNYGSFGAAEQPNVIIRSQAEIDDLVRTTEAAGTWGGTNTAWGGTAPVVGAKTTINHAITVDADITTDDTLEIGTGSLTITTGNSLTINSDLITNNNITIESGASLIVSGTSTGNVTYNRNLGTTNWYMLSSPVTGQGIVDFYTSESPALGSGTGNAQNVAIAPYDNSEALTTDRWNYYTEGQVDGADGDDTTDTFTAGNGYTVKLQASGDVSFTGTIPVDNFTTLALTDNSGGSGTAYNLMGNPYPSYIASDNTANPTNNILTVNSALLTQQTIWIWDQSKNGTGGYNEYNNTSGFHIAPGQAFFVSANGAATTFAINENMQSHQGTGTFLKTESTRPEIQLIVSDGTSTEDANIFYIDGTTTGFDNGYDSSIFGGVSYSFSVFTEAIANGKGEKLGIQSLPNSDLESMIVPVGVNAASGKEITFSAEALNLPSDMKVFLEDRLTNTFTRLDELNSNYKITLDETLNGIGRFYLHTRSSVLSTNDVSLENISIYKTNNSTLRIAGLQQGNSTIKLFNILGKQMMNKSFDSNGIKNISLPKLSAGVYIVQLETESGKLNKKIILE
ncbi:T9SS type A sorting domain-containing protein [Polaribacter sp. Z014]|uniref:T9SS type A sorting domain-containing protein n=1 Tax=Polaribacter sp. Z014 TaxID=2927126 RepID=UPI0020201B46|nr:T9SS type A sorting domain-containing protein [Polaribacter sp. Z014]MCL7764949.1 T9SS type A sorting domain-containing protein [Polaribacter sp. Z014]